MTLLAWLFGLIVLIVAIAVAVAFLNRFYRKTSRDVALIRTGFGGQKIVLSGGTPGAAVPAQGRRDQHADDARSRSAAPAPSR